MSDRWQRIQALFLQAAELPPEKRSSFLDTACPADADLRREVESLLAHDGDPDRNISEALEDAAHSLFASLTIKLGTRLGDYQVQELIGSGGMGEVYRARDKRLARSVAVKVLPSLLRDDPDRLRRFEQEAQAAAALNHPNILAVYQLGAHEGAPYMVTELLEGATLREHLARGPLPVRAAVDYGVQIARGLAAAHERGVTHRDLKPENLFVTRDGRIKILDFGLAKFSRPTAGAEELPEAGLVFGTVGYMAPEQVRGDAVDYRSDIFALGAILYEMLSGRRAFQKPTSAETMSAILNDDPAAISQVVPTVPALHRVVHRCLEKNPERRFQSASDLAFALEALSDTAAGLPGLRSGRRTWRSSAWVAGFMVLLAAALGYWWTRPVAAPRIENVRQLSDDGEPKGTTLEAAYGSLASDGSRVFFNEKRSGNWRIVQLSAVGGQSAVMNTSVQPPIIAGFDPNSSNLLTLNGWALPLPAGDPRRLGDLADLDLTSAEYFPDGQHIVYASGIAIYVADKNGAHARKLLQAADGEIRWLSVSPDGRRIRFTFLDNTSETIREISADGTGKHERLIVGRLGDSDYACCGKWTRDGRYYIFLSGHQGSSNIWALAEDRPPWRRTPPPPTQLTYGPLAYYQPLPGSDNRSIFAIGAKQKGELVRYDASRGEFVPYLGGISATDAAISADGQWVVYLSYPDSIVWRSRPDGSDRMQLSTSRSFYPRISPDAGKVIFVSWDAQKGMGLFLVSMQGGAPQRILDDTAFASWSPDGSQVIAQVGLPHPLQDTVLRIVDLGTRGVRDVPGSHGRLVPLWLDARTLVASSRDGLAMFDLASQKWSSLATGDINNWASSLDGRYVYFERTEGSSRKAWRVRISDRVVEPLVDLGAIRRVEQYGPGTWLGVTSDGSVLVTRDTGTQEIYALDVIWP